MKVLGWILVALGSAAMCLLLWAPSSEIGIVTMVLLGQHSYYGWQSLLPHALVSAVLLVAPVLVLWIAGWLVGFSAAARGAAAVVVGWQGFWAAYVATTGRDDLLGWPFHALPSEPEPWNPVLIHVVGLSLVGLVVLMATLLVAPRGLRRVVHWPR